MSALSEKILRSRESVVPAGGFKFTIRRPTDLDMIEFSKARRSADLVRFVVGWKDVTNGDLYPGATARRQRSTPRPAPNGWPTAAT